MDCPHCHSSSTIEREGRTVHGFRRFRCRECGRRFNERTGTALNRIQVPTDIVFLVVFWRLCYKLSLRDLAEMFGQYGTNNWQTPCSVTTELIVKRRVKQRTAVELSLAAVPASCLSWSGPLWLARPASARR